MNAKNLPLVVAKELQEISEFLKEKIARTDLQLRLQPRDGFGFTVTNKKFVELQFSIISYRIFYEKALYTARIVPQNELTSIDNSNEEVIEMYQERVLDEFIQWVELLTNFEKLAPVNFADLFRVC